MAEESKNVIPLFHEKIPCGLASAIDGYLDMQLNLNSHLISNPASTFFLRCKGDSMIEVGIFPEDIIIVDKSLEPKDKDIVVAIVNNEFTVKILSISRKSLLPANPKYSPVHFKDMQDLEIWGVVTYVIHKPKA